MKADRQFGLGNVNSNTFRGEKEKQSRFLNYSHCCLCVAKQPAHLGYVGSAGAPLSLAETLPTSTTARSHIHGATRNGQQHLFCYKTPKHQHLPFFKAFTLGQVEILCRYFYQMWRFTEKKQRCLEITEGFTMESKNLVLFLMEKPPTRHMFFDTLRNGHWKEL